MRNCNVESQQTPSLSTRLTTTRGLIRLFGDVANMVASRSSGEKSVADSFGLVDVGGGLCGANMVASSSRGEKSVVDIRGLESVDMAGDSNGSLSGFRPDRNLAAAAAGDETKTGSLL